MENAAPAGWHRDPGGKNTPRYWDGIQWTVWLYDGQGVIADGQGAQTPQPFPPSSFAAPTAGNRGFSGQQFGGAPAFGAPPAFGAAPVFGGAPGGVAVNSVAASPFARGVAPASPWLRLGSYLLESVLISVTLGIGWLIWAVVISGSGQTPAKRILGLRVIDGNTNRPASLGKMFWGRGFLGGLVAGLAIPFSLGILALMPFWDKQNQNLWDKVSNTHVVTDPNNAWGAS